MSKYQKGMYLVHIGDVVRKFVKEQYELNQRGAFLLLLA